jgi:hypothetical protein
VEHPGDRALTRNFIVHDPDRHWREALSRGGDDDDLAEQRLEDADDVNEKRLPAEREERLGAAHA